MGLIYEYDKNKNIMFNYKIQNVVNYNLVMFKKNIIE